MSNFNLLCWDLTELPAVEKRLLRLHGEHRLSAGELADLYEVSTRKVKKLLTRAVGKYNEVYSRFKWPA